MGYTFSLPLASLDHMVVRFLFICICSQLRKNYPEKEMFKPRRGESDLNKINFIQRIKQTSKM